MTQELARLPPGATAEEAIRIMEGRRISCILVDRNCEEEPWGIVTRRDVVWKIAARGLDPARVRLRDVMNPALLTVDPALDVGYASRLMRRFGVRHLPVLQGESLVGILTYHDVLHAFSLLTHVPFFEKLPVEDLIALLCLASIRHCPAGEILIREGELGRDLFLLERGEMSVVTRRAGRIARIRPGELFGEMELFGGLRSATVRAVQDSRLLVIDGGRFLSLALARQRVGAVVYESMARVLSDRLRRANRFLFLRGLWTHRAFVLRATAVGVATFVAAVLATAAVSENPAFCRNCHFMRPYHDSWSASPHRKIACTNCHKSYGLDGALHGKITGLAMTARYVTSTYSPNPKARVADGACLHSGCHAAPVRTAGFLPLGSGTKLGFDHAVHLRPTGALGKLHCTSCHNHRGGEEHFSVSASTCFLCHFADSGAPDTPCRGCHETPAAVIAAGGSSRVNHAALPAKADCRSCHRNVAAGGTATDPSRCTSCHLRPSPLPPLEMHRAHLGRRDVDCFDCHATVTHPGQSDRVLAGRCEGCHQDEHAAQERLYLGEGGAGVSERPALMFYMHVECTACHRAGGAATDSARVPAHKGVWRSACTECHDLTFEEKARMWQTTIRRAMDRVQGDLERFEARTGGGRSGRARTDVPVEAIRMYNEARKNFDVVAADPSAGIHNFRYAEDLLKASEQRLGEAFRLLDSGAVSKR